MRLRRMPSHPILRLEGRSKHFQSFWELELTPGEATNRHQHYDSEEVIYLVSGVGQVLIEQDEHRVREGEVVLVPPRTDHIIANRSDRPLRAITVESRFDLRDEGGEAPLAEPVEALEKSIQAQEEARRTLRSIEQIMHELPGEVDEAVAIKTIVELFDVGGHLSEQIEREVGLDNAEGLKALGEVERRIMLAVVKITGRYAHGGRGWLFG